MIKTITIENINKTFEQNGVINEVLHNVHFEVEPGEFVCIVGASGGGKSTLLKILCGLEQATSGGVVGMSDKVGFVFQNFALFPWLSVGQNISFGLRMNKTNPATVKRITNREIERIGLEGYEKAHPKELSGGMRQRVGIARALAMDPDVLLLDEPFSSLDEITARGLRKDLLHIWQSEKPAQTIIMVTHLIEEAVELADKIIVMGHNPGHVKKIIDNKLARPRNLRSEAAYKIIDEVTDLL